MTLRPITSPAVAEQLFAGRVEHQIGAGGVDQDHAVDHGIDDRVQPRRAFAQGLFSAFALGQVADDADEERSPGLVRLADRKLHREGRSVLAPADDLAADADDLALAGAR